MRVWLAGGRRGAEPLRGRRGAGAPRRRRGPRALRERRGAGAGEGLDIRVEQGQRDTRTI